MELLESKKDYIFAFCVYGLFNAWSIYVTLRSNQFLHRPSLFNFIFGGALILYFLFLTVLFTKRTRSLLEKWIGGITVAICIAEVGKLLFRFTSLPTVNPFVRYSAVCLYGLALGLATVRTSM